MKTLFTIRPKPPAHLAGDSLPVRTVLSFEDNLTPFLLADYVAPFHVPASDQSRGLGQHHYRGCEAINLVLQGQFSRDASNKARTHVGADDVQWITGGSGLTHELKQTRDFARRGGHLQFVQIWINVPGQFKDAEPRSQIFRSEEIPVMKLPDHAGTVRAISGEVGSIKGPAQTFTPIKPLGYSPQGGAKSRVELAARFRNSAVRPKRQTGPKRDRGCR